MNNLHLHLLLVGYAGLQGAACLRFNLEGLPVGHKPPDDTAAAASAVSRDPLRCAEVDRPLLNVSTTCACDRREASLSGILKCQSCGPASYTCKTGHCILLAVFNLQPVSYQRLLKYFCNTVSNEQSYGWVHGCRPVADCAAGECRWQGEGYTVQEAGDLLHSSQPQQRAAACRLLSALLAAAHSGAALQLPAGCPQAAEHAQVCLCLTVN